MKHKQTGATLVEVLIGGFMILVVLGILIGAFVGISGVTVGPTRTHAETYARDYVRQFRGWQQPVVSCMGEDTDNNGYVTCTVAERTGAPPQQVECVANWLLRFNTGCREYRLRTVDVNMDGTR